MLPGTLSPEIAMGSLMVTSAILTEAAISFLGLERAPETRDTINVPVLTARAFGCPCLIRLPDLSPAGIQQAVTMGVYESIAVEVRSRSMVTGYGSNPMGEQINVNRSRFRMSAVLYPGFVRSQEAIEASRKAQGLRQVQEVLSGGFEELMRSGMLDIRTYLQAQRDMEAFLALSGCDSPTTRQMEAGMVLVTQGRSVAPGELSSAEARLVSDAPQAAGEVFTLEEACLGDAVWERSRFCPCVVTRALAVPAFRADAESRDPVVQWQAFTRGDYGEAGALYQQCSS